MERKESEAQAQAAVFDWARWEQSQTPVLKAMYIELKVGSNKATEEQLTFIDTINRIGGKAVIVYGSDAAIEVIKAYLCGTIENLDIKSDTYPAEKAKLTDRVNAKRFIGFCGKDCRTCDNMGCLGRKE